MFGSGAHWAKILRPLSPIRRFLRSKLGLDLEFGGRDLSRNGYSESLTLLALVAAQGVAMVKTERLTVESPADGPRTYAMVAYTVLAIMILWLFTVLLSSSRKSRGSKKVHAFNADSVRFMWRAFFVSFILMFTFISLGVSGLLPDQRAYRERVLDVAGAELHEFKDTRATGDGVKVFVPLSRDDFPAGFPDSLQLNLRLDDDLARNWEVRQRHFYKLDIFTKERVDATDLVYDWNSSLRQPPTSEKRYVFKPLDNTSRYEFEFFLWPLSRYADARKARDYILRHKDDVFSVYVIQRTNRP